MVIFCLKRFFPCYSYLEWPLPSKSLFHRTASRCFFQQLLPQIFATTIRSTLVKKTTTRTPFLGDSTILEIEFFTLSFFFLYLHSFESGYFLKQKFEVFHSISFCQFRFGMYISPNRNLQNAFLCLFYFLSPFCVVYSFRQKQNKLTGMT